MTCQRLTTALLRLGSGLLAELWDCDQSEVSRRLNGQRNIPLADICAALDHLDIRLVTPDEDLVTMPMDEAKALNTLAMRYLIRRTNGDD